MRHNRYWNRWSVVTDGEVQWTKRGKYSLVPRILYIVIENGGKKEKKRGWGSSDYYRVRDCRNGIYDEGVRSTRFVRKLV